jgi:hypothetical protein
LGESFEVFLLPVDRIPAAADPGGLAKTLQRTGHWHHQVLVDGKAWGYARSATLGSAQHQQSVQHVLASRLAGKVAKATEAIDAGRPEDDTKARFVTIPAYQVHAFLLEGPRATEVFVVDSPHAQNGPQEGKFYTETEFLQRLLAATHIQGIR